MLVASPVLHDEPEVVGVEEETLRIPRPRRPQVDQEDDGKLETLGRMNRQQRNRIGGGQFLRRLTHGQLRVDDLIEVAHEVANAGQGEVAFETRGKLKDLAEIEQRSGAAVSLGAE